MVLLSYLSRFVREIAGSRVLEVWRERDTLLSVQRVGGLVESCLMNDEDP